MVEDRRDDRDQDADDDHNDQPLDEQETVPLLELCKHGGSSFHKIEVRANMNLARLDGVRFAH